MKNRLIQYPILFIRRLTACQVFLTYLFVTVLLAFPLIRSITTKLPSDRGDPVLNTWILWWNTQAVPFTAGWWSSPNFYPMRETLTYSEHLLGLVPIFAPFYWVSGSPVVAYNVTFLLTFPLAGWAMYKLCTELTGRRDAAWLAGLAFAFAPYRMDQLAHIQVLASFWMPLALMALHRYYRDERMRWLILFGVSVLMLGLSNLYFLLFFPVLVVGWVAWFTTDSGGLRKAGAVCCASAVGMLPMLPILLRYRQVHEFLGLERPLSEIERYSADVTGLFSASSHLVTWGWLDWFTQPEGQLFPGITVVLVIGWSAWCAHTRFRASEFNNVRVFRVAATVVAVGVLVGFTWWLFVDAWNLEWRGSQFWVSEPEKVLGLTVLACIVAFGFHPMPVTLFRRRSVFAFYLCAGLALTLLALGPKPTVMGTSVLSHAPYLGLMQLPGFDGVRVPARFWMLTLVCLSTLIGIGCSNLLTTYSRWSGMLFLTLTVGVLLDGWVRFPVVDAPARSVVLERKLDGPVLELPMGWRDDDLAAMFRTTHHGQPVVNGYSGYVAPHYAALVHGLGHNRVQLLQELGGLGVKHFRIDRTNVDAPHYESLIASSQRFSLVAETDSEALYQFREPQMRRGLASVDGAIVPLVSVTSNVNSDLAGLAADGDLKTLWMSESHIVGDTLSLDVGVPTRMSAVVMSLGSSTTNFPRGLSIEISRDGITWETVWNGPTDYHTFVAALQNPEQTALVFPVGNDVARYVRLEQQVHDPNVKWSVAEIEIRRPIG